MSAKPWHFLGKSDHTYDLRVSRLHLEYPVTTHCPSFDGPRGGGPKKERKRHVLTLRAVIITLSPKQTKTARFFWPLPWAPPAGKPCGWTGCGAVWATWPSPRSVKQVTGTRPPVEGGSTVQLYLCVPPVKNPIPTKID